MSEANHTKGPWQCGGQKSSIGNNHFFVVGPPSKISVANVWDNGRAEDVANSELIAAAPDLLQFLRDALPFIEDAAECELYKKAKVRKFAYDIKKLINRAEGKS